MSSFDRSADPFFILHKYHTISIRTRIIWVYVYKKKHATIYAQRVIVNEFHLEMNRRSLVPISYNLTH